MKSARTFFKEPTGSFYNRLLEESTHHCNQFLLVVRDTILLADSGRQLLARLEPFELSRERVAEWPGTMLLEDTAEVRCYSLSTQAIEILKASASGLYSWLQPELPEDLCLLRAEGTPWLVTIAHERDSYLELEGDEWGPLYQALPELADWLEEPDTHVSGGKDDV